MLRDALASLADLQTHGKFQYEVVVVDNASTDPTPEVVETFRSTTRWNVRYVHESRKGIAFARNRGVREATGEWVAFFDDDQLADANWLWALWSYATEHELWGVGGAVVLKLPDDCSRQLHATVRMLLGEALHSQQPFPYSHKYTFGTGNLMLHRRVFEQVGLFNEVFVARAEDTDLFCRIYSAGIPTWYVPEAIVHHMTPYARLQLDYLQRLARNMGESIAPRELERYALPTFTIRWLAKGMRFALWQRPRQHWAHLRGDAETALGLLCLNTITGRYLANGWKLLTQQWQQTGQKCLHRLANTSPANSMNGV
jgi:GT2 family glycosyltransferase